MKRLVAIAGFLALLLMATPVAYADSLTFSFSSTGNAVINFDGSGNFTFTDSTTTNAGGDFVIGVQFGSSWPNGTMLGGLVGNIGGSFAIGAITVDGGNQSAPVTGSGTFSIFDGVNTFTADLVWVNIMTSGTGGTINSTGTVNLSNFSYSGTNADLAAFANAGPNGIVTVTFQFIPAKTLTQLKDDGATNTYSGTATAVPEPGTLALLGTALLGLAGLRRKLG